MDGKLRQMTALYLLKEDQILLLYRVGSRVVDPCWCGIGGHLEPEEIDNARACVLREVHEEIGLTEDDMEDLTLRYVTVRYTKGELRYNHYFFACLKDGTSVPETCDEGRLEWVSVSEAMERNMPVSAGHMLEHYLTVGKNDDILYGGITAQDGTRFVPMGRAE
ncbi:MAG: NUDIX domain-containing protein [Clostridia bacterium]|nr:NUDIX domain-containing protein [Clostridia bacterium]